MKIATFQAVVIATLATVFSVSAQTADRKLLTMEDAILNKSLIPQKYPVEWSAENPREYITATVDKHYAVDIRTGKRRTTAAPSKKSEGLPRAELRDNNIVWLYADGTEHKVTDFSDRNIVCGTSVSRNEFGIGNGLFPSPDNSRLAFYIKDESRVGTFPLVDITTRTGTLEEIKYPMNGMPSERIKVGVYDTATRRVVYLDVTDFDEERYLIHPTWSPDSRDIYVQVLDRRQKNMHLNRYNASDGRFVATILTEHSDRYVEPSHPLYFIDGDSDKFIYTTNNRDGFRNLYLCSVSQGSVERLTAVDADVTYIGQSGDAVYYYSAEVSPIERHLFRKSLRTGKTLRLTREAGWHNCTLSPDGRYFADDYSSLDTPRVVAICSTDGGFYREEFRADNPSKEYNYSTIELGSVRSADGKYDNYYRLIKPLDFDPSKRYPVILYVYGGPHSQLVRNNFQATLRRWEMYMAQHGYVVFVMDNRGTANRGAEYEQAIHRRCGKCEMEDQMAGLRWLLSHEWADSTRVGVHGWSYGGFMTISLMTNYPEVFKVGVAGGPVIDWKWYEVMYGERYMETEQTNAEGFAEVSLIPRAKDLKGKLLICQGAMDRTVVWLQSLNFIDECIKQNIQVDYFPYPRADHNVVKRDRVHLMQKVTDYFEDFLK